MNYYQESEQIFRSQKILMNENKKKLILKEDIEGIERLDIENNENNENKLFIEETIKKIKYIFKNLPSLPDFLIKINEMDNIIHESIYIQIVELFQKNKFDNENINIIKNKYYVSENFILENINIIIEYYEKLYLDDNYYNNFNNHKLNNIYIEDNYANLFI